MVHTRENNMGGLGEAIESIGGALGQVLQQRGQKQQQQQLQANLSSQFGQDTALGKILSMPGGLQVIQQLGPVLGPLLKEETKQQGITSFFDKYKAQPDAQSSTDISPIALARAQPQMEIPGGGETVQTPQGSFKSEEIVEVPGFGSFPRQMIGDAIQNPNEQVRRWGEGAQKSLLEKEKGTKKERLESDKRSFEENKPFSEQMNKIREGLATKEINLFRINEALDSGNVRTWQNFMADYFDNEFIRSAEGSDLLSATKEEFITDMQQMPAGTRLNQYLEKNMREALQTIGKNVESNRIITKFQEFKTDISKEKLKIYDNTRNSYLDKGLEPPRNLQFMVDAQLKEYTNKKQKEFTKDVRDIRAGKIKSTEGLALEEARKRVKGLPSEPGTVWMLAPDGNTYSIPQNKVKEMQSKEGGIILR